MPLEIAMTSKVEQIAQQFAQEFKFENGRKDESFANSARNHRTAFEDADLKCSKCRSEFKSFEPVDDENDTVKGTPDGRANVRPKPSQNWVREYRSVLAVQQAKSHQRASFSFLGQIRPQNDHASTSRCAVT